MTEFHVGQIDGRVQQDEIKKNYIEPSWFVFVSRDFRRRSDKATVCQCGRSVGDLAFHPEAKNP